MLILNDLKYLLIFILPIHRVLGVDKWYKAADGNNYLINADNDFNWFGSALECASKGLSLVTITTEEKNKALIDVLRKTGKNQFWIGGIRSPQNGGRRFYWIGTGEEFDYTYWRKGEPNGLNNNDDNCVHMEVFDYEWNDHNCATRYYPLLCEENSQIIQLKKYVEQLENYTFGKN